VVRAAATSRPQRSGAFWALLLAAAFVFAGLLALGIWQLQRLAWKQDLLARLEQRLQAAPVPAPGPAAWPTLSKAADEYRRVSARGRYDHGRETLVVASTALGSGYWVLTPLHTEAGDWQLVNRGFVPSAQRTRESRAASEPQGLQTVPGLLRLSEPGGSLLQRNEPAAGRWYSRDVAAIAAAHGLQGPVAPFFIDAAADATAPEAWPRGGLTVLSFSNNHRVYALTWFALAAMVAGAMVFLWREQGRRRPSGDDE
jgi:surfeit locus 1 family protein